MLQSDNLQACCVLICVAERIIWPRQVWVAQIEREAIKWEASLCFCVSVSVKMSRQGGPPHCRDFKITLRYATLGMTPLVE